jgi:hypothetical protein
MRLVKVIVVAMLLGGFAMAQESLGDLARQQRAEKKNKQATHVISNDELPASATVNPENATPYTTTASSISDDKTADKKTTPEADQAKIDDGFRKRVKEQKDAIALLERELTVSDREHKLQVAAFYADAGSRLRNDAQWAKQERQYQEETKNKQQALDDARKKLDDIRDEGRKAGASPSALD